MTRHAEIAGAGMVGLTAACCLARRGWTVRVHEKASDLREIGAGMSVWPNGIRALEDAGALANAELGTDRLESWQLLDHRGRVLQDEWMSHGVEESRSILRPQVHAALVTSARDLGVEIVTSSRVIAARETGELVLESGEVLAADLVIGADGVHSPVRESLGLTKSKTELPDGGGRHLIKRLPSDPVNIMIETWVGGRRIGILPCSEDQVYMYLCCPADDATGRAQTESLQTWFDDFPQLRPFLERIELGAEWRQFTDVAVSAWHRGKVALVGDAACAMSPNLGQAACVGMSNASALAQALDSYSDLEEALVAWEAGERSVTDATQRYSRFYGWIGTHWPRPLIDLRSALIWTLGRSKRVQNRINVATRHVPSYPAPRSGSAL
ncbi:MAG: monooxygenase [Aeromicrobium sp.]|jgi:2-polyprenyl-6-methoxyphenol hydroxylase-like FAD-dependent oxidoreductase|nr:monooxygenase [Aeromicrobium sp.]